MAVQRSIAFQNARKSVGQTTYYRRAGVQMVRSKPTFAPGRTFTTAQLVQQYKMQIAQAAYKDQGIINLVPYMNCQNNKRYNASSKYNRWVRQILLSIPDSAYSATVPAEEYAQENLFNFSRNMSIGNITMAQRTKANYWYNGGAYYLSAGFDEDGFYAFLETARRKLKTKKQLTYKNIGICGLMSTTGDTGLSVVINPTMPDVGLSADFSSILWKISDFGTDTLTQPQSFILVFFISMRSSDANTTPDSVPILCTSSSLWSGITKDTE